METIKITNRLTNEERETVIIYDNIDKKWRVDTTLTRQANKLKKQCWTQTSEYVYEDGMVIGGCFEGSEGAITFRNPNKKRVMSEKQMKNLLGGSSEDEEDDD